jgi:hypothetical protein
MKKILVIIGVILGIVILIGIIGAATSQDEKKINNTANTPTLELQKQEQNNYDSGTDFEKQVFDYSKALYRKYEQEAFDLNDASPDEGYDIKAERLEKAEERAIAETAQKFGISENEVIDIVSKLQ